MNINIGEPQNPDMIDNPDFFTFANERSRIAREENAKIDEQRRLKKELENVKIKQEFKPITPNSNQQNHIITKEDETIGIILISIFALILVIIMCL